MEENVNVSQDAPLGKNSLNFGLITAALLILFSLVLYILELWDSKPLSSLSFVIMIVVMFMGIKTYRDKLNNGLLSYGRGFTVSFMIGLIATVLVTLYTYVFYKFFDPGAIEKIVELAEESMLNSGRELSDEELDMALDYTRKFTSPGWMTFWSFIGNLLASLIISLILPLFLKKEEVFIETND